MPSTSTAATTMVVVRRRLSIRLRLRALSSARVRPESVPKSSMCMGAYSSLVQGHARGASAALLRIESGLQDQDGGHGVDDLATLPGVPARRLQHSVRLHCREPLIDQTDGHLDGPGDGAEELLRRTDGGPVAPVEGARPTGHDLERRLLVDQCSDPRHGGSVVIATDDFERGREDPVGVARGDPHADAAHVEGDAAASPETRHASVIAAATASSACTIRVGSWPPPCARSGLPPPPPPSSPHARLTRSPARSPRACAPASAATTTLGLPPTVPAAATTTASASIRFLTSVTKLRTSPASATSPRSVAEYTTPPRSRAPATASAAAASTRARPSSAIVRSASLSRSSSDSTRPGTSAPGTLSISDSDLSRVRSRARPRKASSPTEASTRRVPEPTEASDSREIGPTWLVRPTCVPPHSSRENGPPMSTTRTTPGYFSPNSARAPERFASSSGRYS